MRIDTNGGSFAPAAGRPGVEILQLFRDAREDVRLERWAPGAEVALPLPGGIEVLVLEGSFRSGGEDFAAQSWLRLPVGATLEARAGAERCTLWAKSGHLAWIDTASLPQAAG